MQATKYTTDKYSITQVKYDNQFIIKVKFIKHNQRNKK